MSDVSVRSSSRNVRDSTSRLPHWADVPDCRRWPAPPERVASILADLVSWSADIAIKLTRDAPEEREAIERIRGFALSWLAGAPCPNASIDDLLTTTAALLAGIDRDLVADARACSDDDVFEGVGA